jgi:hypothetical protein
MSKYEVDLGTKLTLQILWIGGVGIGARAQSTRSTVRHIVVTVSV